MRYRDAVTLVRKDPRGNLERVPAIVLAANVHVPLGADRKPVKDAPAALHVDLAFPVASTTPDGSGPKTRSMDEIFRLAYDVPPSDGESYGWTNPCPPLNADVAGPSAEDADGDRIDGSAREVVEFAAEQRARVLYDKSKEIDALTEQLKAANDELAELRKYKSGCETLSERILAVARAEGKAPALGSIAAGVDGEAPA